MNSGLRMYMCMYMHSGLRMYMCMYMHINLRDAGVAHERRPHEAMHRLIPQDGTEGSIIQRSE